MSCLAPLFSLGRVVATPGAIDAVSHHEMIDAISRHNRGDWGDCCPEDSAENNVSLREGFRLLSVYSSVSGVKFWIVTEADRSSTCVILPSEY